MGLRFNNTGLQSPTSLMRTNNNYTNWFFAGKSCDISSSTAQYILDVEFTTRIWFASNRLYVNHVGTSGTATYYWDISSIWNPKGTYCFMLFKNYGLVAPSLGFELPGAHFNGVTLQGADATVVSTGSGSARLMTTLRRFGIGASVTGGSVFGGTIDYFGASTWGFTRDIFVSLTQRNLITGGKDPWAFYRLMPSSSMIWWWDFNRLGVGGETIARVVTVSPSSDVDPQWSCASAATHWQSVLSDDANYIQASRDISTDESGEYDLIGFSNPAVGSEYCASIFAGYRMRSPDSLTFTCGLRTGTSNIATATHNTSTKTLKTATWSDDTKLDLSVYNFFALAPTMAKNKSVQVWQMLFYAGLQKYEFRDKIANQIITIYPVNNSSITQELSPFRTKQLI